MILDIVRFNSPAITNDNTESSLAENTIRQAMQRCSLDEFLAQKEAASAEFLMEKSPGSMEIWFCLLEIAGSAGGHWGPLPVGLNTTPYQIAINSPSKREETSLYEEFR